MNLSIIIKKWFKKINYKKAFVQDNKILFSETGDCLIINDNHVIARSNILMASDPAFFTKLLKIIDAIYREHKRTRELIRANYNSTNQEISNIIRI